VASLTTVMLSAACTILILPKGSFVHAETFSLILHPCFNPFRSYVGPRPTLWFSCSWRFSWSLTLSNSIFLPPTYSPALIYFGWERGWWITCNYPSVLNKKNKQKEYNLHYLLAWKRKIIMLDFVRHYDFPVPDAFLHVVWTLANR
jgi:hypothetical protein